MSQRLGFRTAGVTGACNSNAIRPRRHPLATSFHHSFTRGLHWSIACPGFAHRTGRTQFQQRSFLINPRAIQEAKFGNPIFFHRLQTIPDCNKQIIPDCNKQIQKYESDMYVYIYIYMCVCGCTYIYIHIYIYIYIHTHTHIYIHIYINTYIHIYILYILYNMYMCVCVIQNSMYVYIYIIIYIRIPSTAMISHLLRLTHDPFQCLCHPSSLGTAGVCQWNWCYSWGWSNQTTTKKQSSATSHPLTSNNTNSSQLKWKMHMSKYSIHTNVHAYTLHVMYVLYIYGIPYTKWSCTASQLSPQSRLPSCPHLHPCRLWHILLDHSHPGCSLQLVAPSGHPSGHHGHQRHPSAP